MAAVTIATMPDALAATTASGQGGDVPKGERPHVAVFDGLRGLAILMVVATHAWGLHPSFGLIGGLFRAGGYGVQIFFVVSATTLMLASSRRRELDLGPFAIRRIARIAPLYYSGLLFYILVHVMDDQRRAPLGIALNMLFIHGFFKNFQNTVVPGGWSIGCEMAFYAAFPILFQRITSTKRALYLLGGSVVLDIALLALDRSQGWKWQTLEWNLYLFPVYQLPVFAAGIAAYHASKGRPIAEGTRRVQLHVVAILSFCGLIAVAIKASRMDHQNWQALPVAPLAGLLVYSCVSAPPKFLTSALMVRLGLVSYSIYIWHFAVMFGVFERLAPAFVGRSAVLIMVAEFLATFVVTWGIAELSRRWIEVPGIEIGRILIRKLGNQKIYTAPS